MKKVRYLLTLLLFLPMVWVYPQSSIKLTLLTDLNSLDLGSMFFANDLRGQARIFQVVIEPYGKEVFIQGEVYWKENLNSSFDRPLFTFTTNIFRAKSFFNDELGNSEVTVDKNESDKTRVDELMKRGKLTGVVKFILRLYDSKSVFLDDDQDEITFSNPSAPIISLGQDQVFPVGNVFITWDEDPSAKDYIILANNKTSEDQSDEEALNSGTLLINNVSVGSVTSINLNNLEKRREFLPGEVIVVQIKKLVNASGSTNELESKPVHFKIEQPIVSSSVVLVPDADLLRLSTLLTGRVDQTILDKLSNGEIQPSQITILDKDGNAISFSDFVRVLGTLELNPASISNINFTPKQ